MDLRKLSFAPPDTPFANGALFFLRAAMAGALFAKHGWEKLTGFQFMAHTFRMDPLHIGVYPSLAFATLSDGICTLLIVAGLFTRAASLIVAINLTVVFVVMQDAFGFLSKYQPPPAMAAPPCREHTELAFLYLCFALFMLVTGAGKYSLDYRLFRRNSA